ncbi:MAG: hypothetical protein L7S45_04035, partial [Luminiphilus sp.]|nr:hypothetical protein [Luminiphilus sp.]
CSCCHAQIDSSYSLMQMAGPRNLFRASWNNWLARRIPKQSTLTLNQRRLFIFPSSAGLAFLALQLLLLLVAINYQNNLIYGLVFLFGTLLVVTVHLTFMNLHGLTLVAVQGTPVFLGEQGSVRFEFVSEQRSRWSIGYGWQRAELRTELWGLDRKTLGLPIIPHRRGRFNAPRFYLETRYPFGLIRCWSWVELTSSILVYPTPISPPSDACTVPGDASGAYFRRAALGDELWELKPYEPGESLKHLHWPSVAKGFDPSIKIMGESAGTDFNTIDFEDYPGVDTELRLSWLCFRVLEASSSGQTFALKLPTIEQTMGSSLAHRDQALEALSLFRADNNYAVAGS